MLPHSIRFAHVLSVDLYDITSITSHSLGRLCWKPAQDARAFVTTVGTALALGMGVNYGFEGVRREGLALRSCLDAPRNFVLMYKVLPIVWNLAQIAVDAVRDVHAYVSLSLPFGHA